MGFNHNSTVADDEPGWGQVDKTRLPLLAFANHKSADPTKKSEWSYPHHWVQDGGGLDEDGVYTTGTMYLHRGGLAAARSAAGGARSGEEASAEIKAHLDAHAEDIGMGESAASALCSEIPADVPEWVMIARTGTWRHPQDPDVQITIAPAHLEAAASYFARHYAGRVDVVIDYHHQSVLAAKGFTPRAPAAGWIKGVEVRADGTELWGHVLWTGEAREAIAARQFRYLSPHLRWDTPDRITGAPVALTIPDVALTNTPYLTELEALNELAASVGQDARGGRSTGRGESGHFNEGGIAMRIIKAIADALGQQPEEVASGLGLDAKAEDKAVAEAICGLPDKLKALEARAQKPPVVNEAIAALIGVDAASDEKAVKAAVLKLQAQASLTAVRSKLGLDEKADEVAILSALDALREQHLKTEAEALVASAIEAGKVPPARKEFWLQAARQDLESAREALNSLSVLAGGELHKSPDAGGAGKLDADAEALCRVLGVSPETFRAGLDN